MGGYTVIGILSYYNLVVKFFLEDEVSSVYIEYTNVSVYNTTIYFIYIK